MNGDFLLVSTPRYDPQLLKVAEQGLDHAKWNFDHRSPIYLLDYHRDRLLKAATHWQWQPAIERLQGPSGLECLSKELDEFIGASQHTPLRLRLLITPQGQVKFEKFDIASLSLPQLFPRSLPALGAEPLEQDPAKHPEYTLVVDSERTSRSEHTHFKTTRRPVYDAARLRASIAPGELKEVLTVNPDDFVMEGSITTPYFWRGGRWVTPPVSAQPLEEIDGSGGQEGVSRRWALESGIAQEEAVAVSSLVDGEECWLSNGARGFMFARIHL